MYVFTTCISKKIPSNESSLLVAICLLSNNKDCYSCLEKQNGHVLHDHHMLLETYQHFNFCDRSLGVHKPFNSINRGNFVKTCNDICKL